MNQLFEKWSDAAKKAQEPLHAMIELNIKTLQSLSYPKPELEKIKKPEEFFVEQFNVVLENSRKGLGYMHESLDILGKAILSAVEDVKNKTEIK